VLVHCWDSFPDDISQTWNELLTCCLSPQVTWHCSWQASLFIAMVTLQWADAQQAGQCYGRLSDVLVCRGVGLDRSLEGRDFQGQISWESLQLRWDLDSFKDSHACKPAQPPPTPKAPNLLERLTRTSVATKEEETAANGKRSLAQKINFKQWRSTALLATAV
jgi:hypothetical protein